MTLVEELRIPAVQLLHAGRQIRPTRLDQQVHVVRHQAPEMDLPVEVAGRPMEAVAVELPVRVVQEDRRAGVASRCDVMDADLLISVGTRHPSDRSVAMRAAGAKLHICCRHVRGLTPDTAGRNVAA
jgi:hypothetical protein